MQKIKDYVVKNWMDQCRYSLARNLRVTEKRIQKAYHELREEGLLPSGKEMRRIKGKRQMENNNTRQMRLDYIVNNWKYKNQTEIAKALGIGRDTIGRMQKELAEKGLIPTGKEMQSIKSKAAYKAEREAYRQQDISVLLMPWVADKWINHNCKWLGA